MLRHMNDLLLTFAFSAIPAAAMIDRFAESTDTTQLIASVLIGLSALATITYIYRTTHAG